MDLNIHHQQKFGDKSVHPLVVIIVAGCVDVLLRPVKDPKEPFAVRVIQLLGTDHHIAKIRPLAVHQLFKRLPVLRVVHPDRPAYRLQIIYVVVARIAVIIAVIEL